MLNAKNGSVDIDGIAVDYICFGHGAFDEASKDFKKRVTNFLKK